MSIQDEYYYHLQDIWIHYVLLEGNNSNLYKITYGYQIFLLKFLINKTQ